MGITVKAAFQYVTQRVALQVTRITPEFTPRRKSVKVFVFAEKIVWVSVNVPNPLNSRL